MRLQEKQLQNDKRPVFQCTRRHASFVDGQTSKQQVEKDALSNSFAHAFGSLKERHSKGLTVSPFDAPVQEDCQWISLTIRSVLVYLTENRLISNMLRQQLDSLAKDGNNSIDKYVSDLKLEHFEMQNIDKLALSAFCYESFAQPGDGLESSNNTLADHPSCSFSVSCQLEWEQCCTIGCSASVVLLDFKPDLLVTLPVQFSCSIQQIKGRLNVSFDAAAGTLALWMDEVDFSLCSESSLGFRVKLSNPQKLHSFLEDKLKFVVVRLLTEGMCMQLFE